MEEKVFLPNIKVHAGEIASKVIVCGDPGRAKQIAELLDDAQELSFAREYRIFNGVYHGTNVTIASHGAGCPDAAVSFEELIKAGAKEIIRVGTASSYVEELPPGSLIVADSAVHEDGLTYQLVPRGMPAVGDLSLVQKVEKNAATKDIRFKRGTIFTLDVFYSGAVAFPHMEYKAAGALGAEMEYIIARMRGVAAAGIFALDGYAFADMNDYNPHTEVVGKAVEAEITIALEALCDE